jgi:L-alanine-DL-glutamate epimerase-like enolase superfamily enzyme
MKVTALETVQVPDRRNLLWVRVHTDEGLVGLGESFRGAETVAAYIHDQVAPYLLGADPLAIEKHSRFLLQNYIGFGSSSAEVRAASAIDIALWDIFGKATGKPIHQLLGGASRERIRAYNTCAGYSYNAKGATRTEFVPWEPAPSPSGPYDDQMNFVHRPEELAQSLIEEGFQAMKIWPVDPFAARTGGLDIAAADLKTALEPFERIRKAVGDGIEVAAELHSMWGLTAALKIARGLKPLNPLWSEDPIKMDAIPALAEYRRLSGLPVCASETLATRTQFRDLLMQQAVDFVMLDVGWCGGLSEARKIGAMAEAFAKPITPHDCTGPVVLIASVHLSMHLPNAVFQEVVRAYLATWYRDLVTVLPRLEKGFVYPMQGPGLGTELQPDLLKRKDAIIRVTKA